MSTPTDSSPPRASTLAHSVADLVRLLVDSVDDYAILTLDPVGNVSSWNTGAERIQGYTPEEVIGRHFSLFYPASDVATGKPQQMLQRALAEGSCEEEGQRLHKDGIPFWARVAVTALFDQFNNHIGFADVTSDITDSRHHEQPLRKEAAAALQACEERYRTLFEHSQIGVVLADAESRYIDANASACRMLGYSRDELIGLHARDIVTQEEARHIRSALSEIHGQSDHHREWQFRRKDGSVFPADVIATKMPDGTLLGLIRDISDHKQVHDYREHLAAIVESSRDAIIGKDLCGIVTSWNAGAAAIFGYAADEMIGTSIARLIPDDRREEETLILAKLRRGDRVEAFETVRRTKDGHLIEVSVTISPITDTGGRIVGASKIARDITALKEHERELARLSRLYVALSQVNKAIVWMPTRDELFRKICRVLVEHGAFRMAWVDWHDPNTHRLVPVAECGDEYRYLQSIDLSRDDPPEGRGPSCTAFRSGRPCISNDLLNDPATRRWRLERERRSFRASAAFPIRVNGDVCGTLSVYADQPEFFRDKEIALLEEAATDLSFALDNFARDEARHQAEQTVRNEKLFCDTMIESMPGVVYLYDGQGRFLRWNRNFETVSGYSGPEIARMHPLDFFSDEEKPRLEQRIAEVFAKGESSIEAQFIAKNGTVTPYFFTGRRVAFEGDVCLVGMGIDISDRRHAEDRLVESERRYRQLVEHANSIILRWNSEGRIIFLNEFGQRFFGYSAEEIVGRHVTGTIVPPTESGGRDLGQLMEYICADPAAFEQSVNENMRRNGERVWIAWTNRIVRDPSSQVVELLSVGTDITKRLHAETALRESEERFRELAETIQEVFWMTDPVKNRVLYISPAYEKIWGRTCASLYESSSTWLDAIHPDDRERVLHAAQTRQSRGDYDETYRILRPNGAVRWIHDRAFPVRGAAGEVLRIVGTAEDITDRRQLEEQFRQSQKMEAIGQLAGGVAHDFNNILSAVLGNTQLALADTAEGHPARESLEEIKKSGVRARSLVQQILAFGRHQPQERRVIELGPSLQEAFNFLRATIPSVVELVFSLDATAPPVLADPTQVYQVIANLCINAWHALKDRPGRVEVKLESVALDAAATSRLAGLGPGRFACLSVTDNGIGMDAATLERIFDPFFTTKEPGKGTGLGLSVVHGIVKGHDGAITVASQPGRGTTFQVYFPAAAAPVDTAATPVPTLHRGEGQHILYLDDEEPLVFLATRMLKRLGYRISGFIHAEDAMKAFCENPGQFDLVITDLNMPGVTGMQVATDLLRLRPDLPVVLCSGHVTEELRQSARNAGICEVLYKPNSMEEFSEAIHRFAAKTWQH